MSLLREMLKEFSLQVWLFLPLTKTTTTKDISVSATTQVVDGRPESRSNQQADDCTMHIHAFTGNKEFRGKEPRCKELPSKGPHGHPRVCGERENTQARVTTTCEHKYYRELGECSAPVSLSKGYRRLASGWFSSV